jgi:glycopeptide antibiotics resistance protein
VHQTLLELPWNEFHRQWSYLKDVLINIAGFVPLGVFFYAYFSSARRIRCAAVATAILGLIVSLTIEVLQAHLPTRNSGVTDVITNTLGTCIGIVIYRTAALPLTRVLAVRHWVGAPAFLGTGGAGKTSADAAGSLRQVPARKIPISKS